MNFVNILIIVHFEELCLFGWMVDISVKAKFKKKKNWTLTALISKLFNTGNFMHTTLLQGFGDCYSGWEPREKETCITLRSRIHLQKLWLKN